MTEPELRAALDEHAARHSLPGAAIAVLRDGEITTAYVGVADARTGEPVTADTRFAIASVTKSLTATAVLRLAADDRLSINDPVAEHVPEMRHAAWAGRATIRDLLANRARVPLRSAWEFEFEGDEDDALSRIASAVATGEPSPPVWSYTNAGWSVLGRALEAVTGLGWEDAMRSILLGPVGMDQTTFTLSPVAEPRATGHEVTTDGPVPVEPWDPPAYRSAGGALSTVTDLMRFAGLHLGDPDLAKARETHAEVFINTWLDGWCLGWARFDWEGCPAWGWDGLSPGNRSILRILPDRHGAVALTTNGSTGRAMYRSLFPGLIQEWFGVGVPPPLLEPSPGAAGDLTRFTGLYAWPDRHSRVTVSGDRLRIDNGGATLEALPTGAATFLVAADDPDNPTVTFGAFDDEGRPDVLYRMLWGLTRVSGRVGQQHTPTRG